MTDSISLTFSSLLETEATHAPQTASNRTTSQNTTSSSREAPNLHTGHTKEFSTAEEEDEDIDNLLKQVEVDILPEHEDEPTHSNWSKKYHDNESTTTTTHSHLSQPNSMSTSSASYLTSSTNIYSSHPPYASSASYSSTTFSSSSLSSLSSTSPTPASTYQLPSVSYHGSAISHLSAKRRTLWYWLVFICAITVALLSFSSFILSFHAWNDRICSILTWLRVGLVIVILLSLFALALSIFCIYIVINLEHPLHMLLPPEKRFGSTRLGSGGMMSRREHERQEERDRQRILRNEQHREALQHQADQAAVAALIGEQNSAHSAQGAANTSTAQASTAASTSGSNSSAVLRRPSIGSTASFFLTQPSEAVWRIAAENFEPAADDILSFFCNATLCVCLLYGGFSILLLNERQQVVDYVHHHAIQSFHHTDPSMRLRVSATLAVLGALSLCCSLLLFLLHYGMSLLSPRNRSILVPSWVSSQSYLSVHFVQGFLAIVLLSFGTAVKNRATTLPLSTTETGSVQMLGFLTVLLAIFGFVRAYLWSPLTYHFHKENLRVVHVMILAGMSGALCCLCLGLFYRSSTSSFYLTAHPYTPPVPLPVSPYGGETKELWKAELEASIKVGFLAVLTLILSAFSLLSTYLAAKMDDIFFRDYVQQVREITNQAEKQENDEL